MVENVLWITCADSQSKDWLIKTVPNLRPWEVALLIALTGESLPRLTRVTAVLPDAGVAAAEALQRLGKQNPLLLTQKWRIWDSREKNGGLHLVLGVDTQSLKALREVNMAPHFCLGRARFYEPTKGQNVGGTSPPSPPTLAAPKAAATEKPPDAQAAGNLATPMSKATSLVGSRTPAPSKGPFRGRARGSHGINRGRGARGRGGPTKRQTLLTEGLSSTQGSLKGMTCSAKPGGTPTNTSV